MHDIRNRKWEIKFEPYRLQGLHISHLMIPCSRIADRIQHLICQRSPFHHENGVLIMQIYFSDVIK
jgi:hypothetical protein